MAKVISSTEEFQVELNNYLKLDMPPAFVAMAFSPSNGRIAKSPRSIKLDAVNASKQHQQLHFENTHLYELRGDPGNYSYSLLTDDARRDFPVVRPDRNGGGEKVSNSEAAKKAEQVKRRREARLEIDNFRNTLYEFAKSGEYDGASLESLESNFNEMLEAVSEIMGS